MGEAAYSESGFWSKLQKYAGKMGCPLLCKALSLYYVFRDEKTPKQAKVAIVGALAYLISFIDVVPDFIPLIGYGDDLAVLAAAMTAVSAYTRGEHLVSAEQQVRKLLPDCKCAEPAGDSVGQSEGKAE